jgi:hypothetical protein
MKVVLTGFWKVGKSAESTVESMVAVMAAQMAE